MTRYSALMLAVLISFSNCSADTFVNRRTGETFNGYATRIKKHNKTQVRAEKKKPQYVDIADYDIRYNYLGRKNKVFSFSIQDSVDLACEAQAFEKALAAAANQGPLFILIEIDTPGGRVDLVNRICGAITNIDNCLTVAFIPAGSFSGAYSTGAAIALACDRLYMTGNATIGGQTLAPSTPADSVGTGYLITLTEKFILPADYDPNADTMLPYITSLARRNNRPAAVAAAMFDELIELVEVTDNQKTFFVDLADHAPNHTIVRTWSPKGSLLRLTGEQAVYCSIADGIINSTDQLLAALKAPQARIAQNKACVKARREFERAEKRFYEVLPAILTLEERADELFEQLNLLDQRIADLNFRANEQARLYRWDFRRISRADGEDLEEMDRERRKLFRQLAPVLDDLNAEYKRAVRLAKDHEDLNANIEALAEGCSATDAKCEQARRRAPKSGERMLPPTFVIRQDGTNPIRGPIYSVPKGAYRPASRRHR
jgi:hypothetical protein